jgi:C-terminal processing protease CtpA/Prc
VLQLVPQGPAARAGVRVGDAVTCIDGVATKGLTGSQLVEKILG